MFKLEVVTMLGLLLSFGLKKQHVLTLLLTLELFRIIIIILTFTNGINTFFRLLLICIGACEGAVGLGTIIRITRIKMCSI